MQTERMTVEDIAGMVQGFVAFDRDVLCKIYSPLAPEERLQKAYEIAASSVAQDLLHKHIVALKLKIG